MIVNDAHCHFFSRGFFEKLARSLPQFDGDDRVERVTRYLGWETPGTPEELASQWAEQLDHHSVERAALMASVPGDEDSVAAAVRSRPDRFVGFFMLDPTEPEAAERCEKALREKGLRVVCLFPAMQRYRLGEERVRGIFEVAAGVPGAAVFVHCGVLTVGVRRRLGLPSPFDARLGHPLDLQAVVARFPELPVIIPHFGAGFFREALMAADMCPNIRFDTSSSNGWVRYCGISLEQAFRQALAVAGPERLLFGTDSSFFPRGWNREIFNVQWTLLEKLQVAESDRQKIFGGNFQELFPQA